MFRVAMFAIAFLAGCGRLAFDEREVRPDSSVAGDGGQDANIGPSDAATAGTFGTMEVGISTQNSGADRVWMSRFTLTEAALVQQLVAHFAPTGGQAANVRGVIYADAAGTPTALIATTNAMSVMPMQSTWVPLAFAAPVPLQPGMYWLGTHNANAISIAYQATVGATKFGGDVFADGADATYAGGATTYAMQLSIYAVY